MMELLRETAARWGLDLQPAQLGLFERYYRELVEWNQRVNLTRITDYRAVQVRHFLDSLTLLEAMADVPEAGRSRLVDVGAGPGLPGLALKIACPELRLTLVEAVARKAAFLRHVVALLQLSQVEVVADRAERVAQQPAHREAYTFAAARALAKLPVALELTLPFVHLGGRVLLPRKGDLAAEVAEARAALELLGGRHLATIPVELPDEAPGRGVVVIEKVAPTDRRYPRRPGMPEKRPLR
ncbi:MAG: 16S rRNA (guanine(527)-N(7))-methyltransferase RsmG [Chloroflexi bacterium]|nr:16S rRNA (guanine(527)-N(7))-methyltransferase RsmG [Chloroflexota bacterium]